jgi:Tol biopolymer transport system component
MDAHFSPSDVRQIYRIQLDGTALGTIAPSRRNQAHPDWSPRADWIAFEQDTIGLIPRCDIWAKNVQTGALQRLTAGTNRQTWPSFAPNGQQVAYASEQRVALPGGGDALQWQVRRVNLDGSDDIAVTIPGDAEIRSVRWSPGGESIFFTRNDTLYSVGTAGRPLSLIEASGTLHTMDLHRGRWRLLAEHSAATWCGRAPTSTASRASAGA